MCRRSASLTVAHPSCRERPPSEWNSASHQRTRIPQADELISAQRRRPHAKVRARFIDADAGDTVAVPWTVRHLAAEQLADYDAAPLAAWYADVS